MFHEEMCHFQKEIKVYLSSAIFLLALLPCYGKVEEKNVSSPNDSKKAEALFRRLYKLERVEQLAAVRALLKMGKEEKQAKMVQAIAEKVFSVIRKSRAVLESSGYIPGLSTFPEDEKTRDALSNVLENTAFFGDILMRLPDLTEALLNNNTEWNILLGWSITFTNQTNLLDNKTSILIDLVSQEMNYTQRHANFTNPYRKIKTILKEPKLEEIKKKVKKKKTLPRGPRLTGHYTAEL